MLQNEPLVGRGQIDSVRTPGASRLLSRFVVGSETSAFRMDRRSAQAGFSLIEVLIASVLLLIISLGIIPLFVRSVSLNQEGRAASLATAVAASELERLKAASFNSVPMSIPAGELEILFEQWQAEPRGEWFDEADWTVGDGFMFHRIVRIRQFGLFAMVDGTLDDAERISGDLGNSNPGLVQLKEVVVQVESGTFPGSVSKEVTLRTIRSI